MTFNDLIIDISGVGALSLMLLDVAAYIIILWGKK